MFKVIGITPITVLFIVTYLREHLKTDEPIDSFILCDRNKLDSCLITPFQRPVKATFIADLIEKSALVFFLLIENHVFPTNGNKRIATLALLVMLKINGYNLITSDIELYNLSIKVTQLSMQRISHQKILKEICAFLKKNTFNIGVDDEEFYTLAEQVFDFYKHNQRDFGLKFYSLLSKN